MHYRRDGYFEREGIAVRSSIPEECVTDRFESERILSGLPDALQCDRGLKRIQGIDGSCSHAHQKTCSILDF
jgi:hypothetical protein